MTADAPFWTKPLESLSEREWEALCDGCGKCCTVILEDEDTGEVHETSVACRLFDPAARRCTAYDRRLALEPGCVQVTPENARTLSWMPETCAYRRLATGRALPSWHPLLTGRRESVEEAGEAVDPALTSEARVKAKHLWRYVTGRRR